MSRYGCEIVSREEEQRARGEVSGRKEREMRLKMRDFENGLKRRKLQGN